MDIIDPVLDPENIILSDFAQDIHHCAPQNDDTAYEDEPPDPIEEAWEDHDILMDLDEILHVGEDWNAVDEGPVLPQNVEESLQNNCLLHYTKYMTQCGHDQCNLEGSKDMALGFALLSEVERVSFVRSIIFACAAPPGKANTIFNESQDAKKYKRRLNEDDPMARASIPYCLKGRQMCLPAFAAITQLSITTIQSHSVHVSRTMRPTVYKTMHSKARKGKMGEQKILALTFLRNYAADYALECPRGRGSKDESPLRMLPSHTTKKLVYEAYKESFTNLVSGLLEIQPGLKRPTSPLNYTSFVRYWSDGMPTLKIFSKGSDFCDTCTTLKNEIASLDDDLQCARKKEILRSHRLEADTEFRFYRSCQLLAHESPNLSPLHLVFDFAEKVLLPKLQKQPGQLHFITGLKFDIFGVSVSNLKRHFIFGLPEGHWPNEKTANVVISMLHYSIEWARHSISSSPVHLRLHADNCAGQNKNRYLIWYLTWRVICGFDESISLYFLVAGHTKNVCDVSFGHVKRKLSKSNVNVPEEMLDLIESSSRNSTCVSSTQVSWRNWKVLLRQYFKIPAALKISTRHVFIFEKNNLAQVTVKNFTNSLEKKSLCLLQKNISTNTIENMQHIDLKSSAFLLPIVPLENVASKMEGNRKNYLAVNVLDRYYSSDARVRDGYFSSGTKSAVPQDAQ